MCMVNFIIPIFLIFTIDIAKFANLFQEFYYVLLTFAHARAKILDGEVFATDGICGQPQGSKNNVCRPSGQFYHMG